MGVNYNTLALGRQGYLSMNMVGSLEQLPMLKPHVSQLLANVEFVEGKRYTDFNSTTDKVAAVGRQRSSRAQPSNPACWRSSGPSLFLCWWREKLLMLLVIARRIGCQIPQEKPQAEQPGGGGGLPS